METQKKNGESSAMKFLRCAPSVMPAVFAVLTLLVYALPAASLLGFSVGNTYALAFGGEPFAKLLFWSGIFIVILCGFGTVMGFSPCVKESKAGNLWGNEWVAYLSAAVYLFALVIDVVATVMIKDMMIFSVGIGVILAIVFAIVFLFLSVIFTVIWRVKGGEKILLGKAEKYAKAYVEQGKPVELEAPRVQMTETITKLDRVMKKKRIVNIWVWSILVALMLFPVSGFITLQILKIEYRWELAHFTNYMFFCPLYIIVGGVWTLIASLLGKRKVWKVKQRKNAGLRIKSAKVSPWGYVILGILLFYVFAFTPFRMTLVQDEKGFLRPERLSYIDSELLSRYGINKIVKMQDIATQGWGLSYWFILVLLITRIVLHVKIRKTTRVESYESECAEYAEAVKVYCSEKIQYKEYKSYLRAEKCLGKRR